jgi:hypothetical protein
MSSLLERKFRIGIIGAPVNTTSAATFVTAAGVFKLDRIAYLAPSDSTLNLNSVNATVDGSYPAAEIAGGIVCNPNYTWAEPESGKPLTQFNDIDDIFTRVEKNQMAAAGIMVIERKAPGDFRIRHALSTDPSSAVTQEFKVVRIKDALSLYLIQNLENVYINTRNIGPETIANITATMKFLLGNVIGRNDITQYQNLEVTQNPSEPREVDIKFQIKPTWDLNWILITFGVSL